MKAKTNKLEHYAELTKALKQRVLDYEEGLIRDKKPYAVSEETIKFALSPTPDRVNRDTYERARSMLNMATVKSRLVIRAYRVRKTDGTSKDIELTTDIRANKKRLAKTINSILHNELSQSQILETQLYRILNTQMNIDPNNLQAGQEYRVNKGGDEIIMKVDKSYKDEDNIAEHITFEKVSQEIVSMIAEVPGTNPNATGAVSTFGNMNLQTWKKADYIMNEEERKKKIQKVKDIIDANPEVYKEFSNLTDEEIEDLQTYMTKSQAWQIAKKNTQDSDQVKDNWTKLYVKGKEARHASIASGNFKPFDEFRRMIRLGDYDTDEVLSKIDEQIKKVLKK